MKKARALFDELYSDHLQRSQMHEILKKNVSESTKFISTSLELAKEHSTDINIRFFTLVAIRHMIEDYWSSFYVSQTEKESIKKKIVDILPQVLGDSKSASLVSEIIVAVVNQENGWVWSSMVDRILLLVEDGDSGREHSMTALRSLLEHAGNQFLSNERLFKILYNRFTENDPNSEIRNQTIASVYFLLKSTIQSKELALEIKLLQVEEMMKVWASVFPMILASKDAAMVPAKVFTIMIYTILIRDFKWALNEKSFLAIPQIIKCLLTTLGDYYQHWRSPREQQQASIAYLKEASDEFLNYSSSIDALVVVVCEVIENFCFYEPVSDVLRKILTPLITSLSLLCVPRPWIFDPELHLKVSDLSLATISTIIERFDHQAVNIITELAFELINNDKVDEYIIGQFEASKTALNEAGVDMRMLKIKPYDIASKYLSESKWTLKVLGLTLLDRFKEDIIANLSQQKMLDDNKIIRQILDILSSQTHVRLILKALDAISIYRYANKISEELFIELYAKIGDMISSKYQMVVRLKASKVLTILSYKIATDKLQPMIRKRIGNVKLNSLIKSVIDLALFIDESHVVFFIDNIVSLYDIDSQVFSNIFVVQGVQSLFRIYRVCMTQNTQTPLFSEFFNRMFTNDSLKSIIFTQLINLFTLFLEDYEESNSGYEGMDHILNVLLSASNQRVFFDNSINLLDKVIDLSTNTNHSVAKLKTSLIIKNIILFKLASPEFTSLIVSQAKVLYLKQLSVNENEANCCYIGNLAIALYTRTAIDNKQEYITSIVRKLNKSALPLTNQGISVFISYLILNDPVDTLKRLSDVQVGAKYGFKILFDHWLLHQPKFTGPRVKSITIKALFQVLMTSDHGLSNLYVIGLKPSHKVYSPEIKLPARILALLKEVLSFEKKMASHKANKNLNTDQRRQFYLEEGDRLETEFESDDDDDDDGGEMLSDSDNMNVDINIEYDKDDDSFNNNPEARNGLAGIETGSQSYMSGLLGFDEVDGAEYDENTENDLKQLGVEEIDIVSTIQKFLFTFKKSTQFKSIEKDLDQETAKFLNTICL